MSKECVIRIYNNEGLKGGVFLPRNNNFKDDLPATVRALISPFMEDKRAGFKTGDGAEWILENIIDFFDEFEVPHHRITDEQRSRYEFEIITTDTDILVSVLKDNNRLFYGSYTEMPDGLFSYRPGVLHEDQKVPYSAVFRFYDNKTIRFSYSSKCEDSLNRKELKTFFSGKLITSNKDARKWGLPNPEFDNMAQDFFKKFRTTYKSIFLENHEGYGAEFFYEITLIGNQLYSAVYKKRNLVYYGRLDDMPEM